VIWRKISIQRFHNTVHTHTLSQTMGAKQSSVNTLSGELVRRASAAPLLSRRTSCECSSSLNHPLLVTRTPSSKTTATTTNTRPAQLPHRSLSRVAVASARNARRFACMRGERARKERHYAWMRGARDDGRGLRKHTRSHMQTFHTLIRHHSSPPTTRRREDGFAEKAVEREAAGD
jgi:hypothetical protein